MIRLNNITERSSTAIGTGLIALDVILNGSPVTPAKLCAGGSCGNVLSILSYFGWDSKPIARLSDNNATKNLFEDFLKFKIDTSLISVTDDGKTPIIIHRILKDSAGNPKHKFEFKIPGTSTWLPVYKPVLANVVENITEKQADANVFYFDRVSRSTIELAKHYSNKGALIIFEPSSLKEDKQTLECLSLAHIIKFSHDRINNYSDLFPTANALLEIETRGKEGLRYRLKNINNSKWTTVESYKFENIIDSAGAGDWCTAGIINELAFNGLHSFQNCSEKEIVQALKIGQALGGINCNFDGARGIMYNMDKESLIDLTEKVLNYQSKITIKKQFTSATILSIKNLEISSLL